MIDLHTHSSASDGEYSPSQLVFLAVEKGISVLAITDHDTVQGLEEASAAAEGKKITFIKGIEININRPRGEFHLLGLGLQKIAPELEQLTRRLQTERIGRNRTIIESMKADGFSVDYAELEAMFPGQSI